MIDNNNNNNSLSSSTSSFSSTSSINSFKKSKLNKEKRFKKKLEQQQYDSIPSSYYLNQEFLKNNLDNQDKNIIIENFYHKLILLKVQKSIYKQEYIKEFENLNRSIENINSFFNSFQSTLDNIKNELLESLELNLNINSNSFNRLEKDNQILDSLEIKYSNQLYQSFNKESIKIITDSDDELLNLMIDNNQLDLLLNENSEKPLVSTSLIFDNSTIHDINLKLPTLAQIGKRIDTISFTNYFNENEKVITNTQSQHDLCLHYLGIKNNITKKRIPSSFKPSNHQVPEIDDDDNCSIISNGSNGNESSTSVSSTSTSSLNSSIGGGSGNELIVSSNVPICNNLLGKIRSFEREEYIEYLEGQVPIYVLQLSHYYLNGSFDRSTMLKYLNCLFDDQFTSANYYCQKLESANGDKKIARLPYISSLKLIIQDIYTFSQHTKYLKKSGILSNSLLIQSSTISSSNSTSSTTPHVVPIYGLDVKSFYYFDESIDCKTKKLLTLIKNSSLSKDIEISINGGPWRRETSFYYIFTNKNESFCDFNDKGVVPSCFTLKNTNYQNCIFSVDYAKSKLDLSSRKYFSKFIDDVSKSTNIIATIGGSSSKIILPFQLNELSKDLINFMNGEYYRSLTTTILNTTSDISNNNNNNNNTTTTSTHTTHTIRPKIYGLVRFILPAIYYFIYNHPYKFIFNNNKKL